MSFLLTRTRPRQPPRWLGGAMAGCAGRVRCITTSRRRRRWPSGSRGGRGTLGWRRPGRPAAWRRGRRLSSCLTDLLVLGGRPVDGRNARNWRDLCSNEPFDRLPNIAEGFRGRLDRGNWSSFQLAINLDQRISYLDYCPKRKDEGENATHATFHQIPRRLSESTARELWDSLSPAAALGQRAVCAAANGTCGQGRPGRTVAGAAWCEGRARG